jgi:hypothetical protein
MYIKKNKIMYRILIILGLLCSKTYAQNYDCDNAVLVCSNGDLSTNPSGIGTQELNASNRGCILANENASA